MLYIGIDVHKKNLEVCVLEESGEGVQRVKLRNERDTVAGYFGKVSGRASVALEPTHNWGMLYDLLEEMGMEVHVCHPGETKLIGRSRVKTDKIDAYKLAALLRAGFLPEAYVPNAGERELRRLVRARAGIRWVGTRLKNQVHAVLREKWIEASSSDLFGKTGREFLANLDIEESYKLVIRSRLELLSGVEEQVAALGQEIEHRAYLDKRAVLLMTVKGIGAYSALLILSEIGEINRFERAESLVRFAGLNPSEDTSAGRTRRGRISKAGSRWLRWILVEAVQHTVREEGKIRDLYLRVMAKKGHNRAIVAAARELLISIYWMLVRMEPYRPSGRRRVTVLTSEAR